jgi:hypothetical protein
MVKGKKKPSFFTKAVDNIKEHWLNKFVDFVFGVVVGVTAFIVLWQHINSGPKIEIAANSIIYGFANRNGEFYLHYTTGLSITNKGDRAYFPESYQLIVKWKDGLELTFDTESIPDSGKVTAYGPMKTTLDVQKDLTRVEKIDKDDIATGFLRFLRKVTPETKTTDLAHYEYARIVIYDAGGKKHISKKFHAGKVEQIDLYLPKSGIETRTN